MLWISKAKPSLCVERALICCGDGGFCQGCMSNLRADFMSGLMALTFASVFVAAGLKKRWRQRDSLQCREDDGRRGALARMCVDAPSLG